MINALKQICTLDEYSDALDWMALADAYEEERNDNAAHIIRGLIISYIQFRSKKNYWPYQANTYTWCWTNQGNINNQSLIPKHIFKYLIYDLPCYRTPQQAFEGLWLAFIEAYHEFY